MLAQSYARTHTHIQNIRIRVRTHTDLVSHSLSQLLLCSHSQYTEATRVFSAVQCF